MSVMFSSVVQLQRELEEERARYRRLHEHFAPKEETPLCWRLTPSCRRLLGALMARERISTRQCLALLHPDGGAATGCVRVAMLRLRRSVAPFGVVVRNSRMGGWYLDAASKAIVRQYAEAGT